MPSVGTITRSIVLSAALAAATSCGSSGSGITAPRGPLVPTFVSLQSDAGDWVGGGQSYRYTQADAVIAVTTSPGHLAIQISGDEWWYGDVRMPAGFDELQRDSVGSVLTYPYYSQVQGGLDWYGEGRGCDAVTGSFIVDSVSYHGAALAAIDLRFEQHCEGAAPALHGTIHWRADDPTVPPGPVNPVPDSLWRPAPDSTPTSGNYVYLDGEPGELLTNGQTYTFTPANAVLTIGANGRLLTVGVSGSGVVGWGGILQTMNSISQIEPGYYPDLHKYPFYNPAKGGMDWSNQYEGCNTLTGWVAVDSVRYSNGNIAALDLRFEQHCEDVAPALHGAVHWRG